MSRTIRATAILLLTVLLAVPGALADRSFTAGVGVPFYEEIRYSRDSETVTQVYVEDAGSMPPGVEVIYTSSGYLLQGNPESEGTYAFTVVCVWSSDVLTIDPVTVRVLPAGETPPEPAGSRPSSRRIPRRRS